MLDTLYINLHNNYDWKYYGMDRSAFWKAFLQCHDRNNNRADFILDLERSILIGNGKCPQSTHLYIGWGEPERLSDGRPIASEFKSYMGLPNNLGYVQNYARLRKACAKWFGVDVKQLPSLPIPKPVSQVREEARRKEYFFTRKLN